MRRHYWGDFFEKISYQDSELHTNFTRPSCSCLAFQIMPHLRWSSDQTASDRSSNTCDSFIFIICVSPKVQGQMSSNSIFRGSPLRNKRKNLILMESFAIVSVLFLMKDMFSFQRKNSI